MDLRSIPPDRTDSRANDVAVREGTRDLGGRSTVLCSEASPVITATRSWRKTSPMLAVASNTLPICSLATPAGRRYVSVGD